MLSHLQMITLYVSDLQRSLAFYRDVLGFVQTAEFNDGEQHLIWLVPQAAVDVPLATEIALFAPPAGDPRIGSATGLVFTAQDIQATNEILRERGVVFVKELVRHEYGEGEGDQEAQFTDPDGNLFLLHT